MSKVCSAGFKHVVTYHLEGTYCQYHTSVPAMPPSRAATEWVHVGDMGHQPQLIPWQYIMKYINNMSEVCSAGFKHVVTYHLEGTYWRYHV